MFLSYASRKAALNIKICRIGFVFSGRLEYGGHLPEYRKPSIGFIITTTVLLFLIF